MDKQQNWMYTAMLGVAALGGACIAVSIERVYRDFTRLVDSMEKIGNGMSQLQQTTQPLVAPAVENVVAQTPVTPSMVCRETVTSREIPVVSSTSVSGETEPSLVQELTEDTPKLTPEQELEQKLASIPLSKPEEQKPVWANADSTEEESPVSIFTLE